MSECRWSGWPGAWCLDCGREDPREVALADGNIEIDCKLEHCTCQEDKLFGQDCPNLMVINKNEQDFNLECSEPGSNRHNPYVNKTP